MKNKMSGLTGSIIQLLRRLKEDRLLLGRYYHFDSEVLKAIRDHIWKAEPCLLINKPVDCDGKEMPIAMHRGSGPSINFKDAFSYGTQYGKDSEPYELDYFRLEITVTFLDPEYDRETAHSYSFNIPIDLEDNFSETKFKKWVKAEGAILAEAQKNRELPKLRELMKRYPDEAKKLMKK